MPLWVDPAGDIPPKTYANFYMNPRAAALKKSARRYDPPHRQKGADTMTTIQDNKQHRTSQMQIGDTLFTVISVESDRARERLYDKVKRLILNDEAKETMSIPTAA